MTELRKALEALEDPTSDYEVRIKKAKQILAEALASQSPPPTDDVRAELEGPFGAFQSTINPDRWYVSDERRKVAALSTEIGASGEREARRVALLLNRDEQARVEGLSLCDSIKAAMGAAGVNARTLAALIGVTESRVSQLLRPNSNLTVRTLERIAEALGTRVHIALSAQLPPPTDEDVDEAHEIGKREGRDEAMQEIDLATGGDGEYRYCTDHDPERHCPDAEAMKARIVARFEGQLPPPIRGEGLDPAGDGKLPLQDRIETILIRRLCQKRIEGYTLETAHEIAALATRSSPKGWVLVPREPTKAMLRAARREGCDIKLVYRAMLAASPSSKENMS